ncbi:MAG: hypothetical protein WCT03_03685 [Candidatus Obscuribacterales bacterium]|jgi:hypothetical protein
MSKLKPQINPKLFIAALSTGAALVLSAATSAGHAQNSVRYTTGKLEQVHSHTTPLKLQLINENPTMTDCRPVEEAPKTYQFNIPGRQNASSAPGVIQINATPRALPSASFNSNIPAGGTGVNRSLPGVEQGHLGKQMAAEAKAIKATSARPIGKPTNAIAPSQIKSVSAPVSYPSYKSAGNLGSASSLQKTTTDATGVIKKRDLLLK